MLKKMLGFLLILCILLPLSAAGADEVPAGVIPGVGGYVSSWRDYFGFVFPIYGRNEKIRLYGPDQLPQIDGYVSTSNARIDLSCYLYENDTYYEVPEYARELLNSTVAQYKKTKIKDIETEETEIDGHPAMLILGRIPDKEDADDWYGFINFARNNYTGTLAVTIHTNNWDAPVLTMEHLRTLAQLIEYDPSKAPSTMEDGTFTISAGDETPSVTAGKTLQLAAVFDKPDLVNSEAKNNAVTWTVVDPETGETPAGYRMDAKKGILTAPKNVAEITQVQVVGDSNTFHTTASCTVTVLPAATAITVDPAELFFYTGTDTAITVQAALTPDFLPFTGIEWKLQKEGIVELTPGENGTASVKPLADGKLSATVSEPGGKKATLKISVVPPVEDVILSFKGKTGPGASAAVSAEIQPKNAGNKTLEWSLDVGDDVAVINEKGKVTISKTAVPGTVINVTCRALGAPEPIERTLQIEVTEK